MKLFKDQLITRVKLLARLSIYTFRSEIGAESAFG